MHSWAPLRRLEDLAAQDTPGEDGQRIVNLLGSLLPEDAKGMERFLNGYAVLAQSRGNLSTTLIDNKQTKLDWTYTFGSISISYSQTHFNRKDLDYHGQKWWLLEEIRIEYKNANNEIGPYIIKGEKTHNGKQDRDYPSWASRVFSKKALDRLEERIIRPPTRP